VADDSTVAPGMFRTWTYNRAMHRDLPRDWERIIKSAGRNRHVVAWLLYGSRAPNWPEPPVPESDYDILGVQDSGSRERRRDVRKANVPVVDFLLVSKRGFRSGQLLSPETHVMLRFGTTVGDWSWCDMSVRLSWAGADDALEDAKALLEAATINAPDNATSACRLALDAVRKCLTLRAALDTASQAPTWAMAAQRYALDREFLAHVRRHTLNKCPNGELSRWADDALNAAQAAVAEAERAVAAYPRNASDQEIAYSVR
jgi:hypothetical protein